MPRSNLAVKTQSEFTYGHYLTWTNDDERWELIDGVAFNMSPAPSRTHQAISLRLSVIIGTFLKDKTCQVFAAPFDVRLPDFDGQRDESIETVVQPDFVVICDETKLDERGAKGAPDLVVEILSPYTAQKDITTKFALYERHRVKEYWLISPSEHTVQIFKLNPRTKAYGRPEMFGSGDTITTSRVLTGLTVDLAEVFDEKKQP
ncbi:MAG: Uma2 family endonuclease [Thermoguttaceae bacterium]